MTQFIDADDLRQSFVVMKNEIIKTLRAKKALLYLALVFAVLALETALPYLVGDGLKGEAEMIYGEYLTMASLLVLLAATLFGSYTIVSEFEERTALVLFTRPIKKSSIFIGKFLSCYLIGAVIMAVYYVFVVIIALAVTGDVISSVGKSFVVMLSYLFACTGVAMLISSFFKKGGTSAVMTFMTILLFISIVTGVLTLNNIDPWFMMDHASGAITGCISEYAEETAGLKYMGCAENSCVLFAWGVATLIVAYVKFLKREF